MLEREGLIVGLSDRHYRRLFSSRLVLAVEARRLDESDRKVLSECRRPVSLAILLSLAVDGPVTHRELAERLGKSGATVTYHLSRLSASGIVQTGAGPSHDAYALADRPRVVSLLATFSGTLRDRVDAFARLWLQLGR
jgi:DNA-binding MarR family transcriptional regulator